MKTGTYIDGDSDLRPAKAYEAVSGPPLPGDPLSIGAIVAGIVLPDLALRMRGQFHLPRIVALAIREDEDRQSR